VKALYGLLIIGFMGLLAVWSFNDNANQFQNDPGPISVPDDVYDPVRAGEEVPQGFRQLLSRDAIRPVYNPTFTSASQSEWEDDTLIIGLELDGEAKAYPVSFLNRREMVNDWIAGSPVLVTW